MKKYLFLTLVLGAIVSFSANAQGAQASQTPPDPAVVLQQMKDQQKPGLVQKVGLTEAQADKFIETNFEMRMKAATELQGLNEADRMKKLDEMKAAKEKKYLEFLTPEQIKAVKAYYEEMAKEAKKPAN